MSWSNPLSPTDLASVLRELATSIEDRDSTEFCVFMLPGLEVALHDTDSSIVQAMDQELSSWD